METAAPQSQQTPQRRRTRIYRWITRQLTRAVFGESQALKQIGMEGMPNASRAWFIVAGFFARFAFLRIIHCDWRHFERIPKGGVIIASNHLSSADPAMVASAIYPRSPRYMSKVELFQKTPVVGYLFALSGGFPVRRGTGDMASLREAERLLAAGAVVGMFPEGHRSDTGAMMEAHPGTALLALRSGAPVVPVGIWGSEHLRGGWRAVLRQAPVRMQAGEPFMLKRGARIRRDDVARAHERLMAEIAAQLPAPYRGVYADLDLETVRRADTRAGRSEPAVNREAC